jgi:hypothetical protein
VHRSTFRCCASIPQGIWLPARAGAVQARPAGNGPVIQRAIPSTARAGSMADLNRVSNLPANDPSRDMGITTEPAGVRAPSYRLDYKLKIVKSKLGHYARVTLVHTAYEGNADSYYLRAGEHYTGFRWADQGFYIGMADRNRFVDAGSGYGSEYVYMAVSPRMAAFSKRAEEEHLADFRRAFQISLGAAEQAIRRVAGTWVGPHQTQFDCNQAVAQQIHAALPLESQGLSLDQAQWMNDFLRLCQRSRDERDSRGWHSFDVVSSGWLLNSRFMKAVTQAWDISAEHPDTEVHYVDVIPGAAMQIGIHSSQTVIHF